MALRINTNVTSIMAQRQLGIQSGGLSKSLERLSSGMRINRAADDAAGLAISETLKAQIIGMSQANANSQDSINLIQTAEGGLNETTSILQRMRELSVQAANDTYTQADRSKIQEEVGQMKEELTRIAQTTQYNGRNLLDGSVGQSSAQIDGNVAIKANTRVGGPAAVTFVPAFGDMISGASLTNSTLASVDAAMEFKIVATATQGTFNLEVRGSDGTVSTINDITANGSGTNIFAGAVSRTFTLNSGGTVQVTFGNTKPQTVDIGDVATLQVQGLQAAVTNDQALTFQIGQNEGQIVKFGMADMTAQALHLEVGSVLGTTDAHSRTNSQNMIGVIDEALRKVNVQRARMGAMQNRMEHSIANLGVASENLSASNSRIRDTDVAYESSQLTRSQILVQAGTAMLAQANASSQNALSLLR
ncbi:MAG: flagellin [Candidatus Sericytochromatia bacterium]|nr:flagellin [Candidatus Sericytochromatia bacterium]